MVIFTSNSQQFRLPLAQHGTGPRMRAYHLFMHHEHHRLKTKSCTWAKLKFLAEDTPCNNTETELRRARAGPVLPSVARCKAYAYLALRATRSRVLHWKRTKT
jgi:hypothetical protein